MPKHKFLIFLLFYYFYSSACSNYCKSITLLVFILAVGILGVNTVVVLVACCCSSKGNSGGIRRINNQ